MDNVAIIILAAGESSRLGRPKQNLFYNGKSLVQHVADEARAAHLSPVVVVTGAFEKELTGRLHTEGLVVVHNPRWSEGMGSGISLGIDTIAEAGGADAVIISVCDQPFLSAGVFTDLLNARRHTGKGIIGSAYGGTVGVPVLYDKKYFAALKDVEEGEGSKKILHRFADDLARIGFDAGAIDIDTEEDYNLLLDQSSEGSLQ